MNENGFFTKPATYIRLMFWRCIAALLGWAVQWRPSLSKPKTYLPYVVLAVIAYCLGRVFGGWMLEVGFF